MIRYLYNPIVCWGEKGHEALGMVAMSELNSKTSRKLKNFLQGKDIVDVSYWGHHLSNHYPDFLTDHLMLFDPPNSDQCTHFEFNNTTCPNNECLVGRLQEIYKILLTHANDTHLIKHVSFKEIDLLKYFITLFGDLHQPLSLGYANDMGGKHKEIRYTINNHKTVTNRYDFYNDGFVNDPNLISEHRWNGGWTQSKALGMLTKVIADEWKMAVTVDEKMSLFEKWAQESRAEFCEIYSSMDLIDHQNYAVLKEATLHLLSSIQHQILVGGTRLAHVLDFFFANRTVLRLRQKSNLDIELEAKIPKYHPISHSDTQTFKYSYLVNLCINMCIITGVLMAFLVVIRLGNSSPARYGQVPEPVAAKHAD